MRQQTHETQRRKEKEKPGLGNARSREQSDSRQPMLQEAILQA